MWRLKSEDLLTYLKENPYVLAPMAAITDLPFRSFMREMGAGILVSELVSSTGLLHLNRRTQRLMEFEECQRPYGIQLFGEDPTQMGEAAKIAQDTGADFLDINFGCPVPKVTNKGAGSACLKDLPHMQRLISAVKNAIEIPLTIKVRTGWDQNHRNTDEVCRIAAGEGVTWVAIHGRTRTQAYAGLADWDYIAEVKANSPVPVLGNGDIQMAEQARERLRSSGVDGVMIGRGALKNPYLFLEIRDVHPQKNFPQMFLRLRTHLEKFYDERILEIQLKKFAAWYATGYPDAKVFRKNIFTLAGVSAVTEFVEHFFEKLSLPQEDTSQEPFLMGGHG